MLLKVFERKFDGGGNVIKGKTTDSRGNVMTTSVSEMYYMDLTTEEETILRNTKLNNIGVFAFEVVLPKDIDTIPLRLLHEGERRKKQIFILFEPGLATKKQDEQHAAN